MYQIIMDYWVEVMQDDVYVVTQDGWEGGRVVRQIFPTKKDGKNVWKEKHDFEFNKERFKAEVIPPTLIEIRFYDDELRILTEYQEQLDSASQALEAFVEGHDDEESLLDEAKNDKGKVTQKLINARIKALEENCTDPDELEALQGCLKLVKAESSAKKVHKDYKHKLDMLVFKKYPKLSESELKALIVEDKWLATLQGRIIAEIERVTQQLANRVKTLEERYETPLPQLTEEVATLSARVDAHLRKMGLQW